MPFCSKCGNQAREGGQFCDRCGAPLGYSSGPYQQPNPGYQASMTNTWSPDRKDPLIAVILSLLLPGVGQIYVGRVTRGIFIMLFMLVFGAISWLPGFVFIDLEVDSFMGFIWWAVIITVVLLIVYIWQVVDAYRLAEATDHPQNAPRRY